MRIPPLAVALLLILAAGAASVGWRWWRRDALVVYCAHDAVFAEEILRRFETESGARLAVRYDTEATKSLGLVELLLREKSAPRCDVFWNNETLGTIDLAARGALAPYRGSGWERMPAQFKDPEGRWTGFAARMRVEIRRADAPDNGDELARIAASPEPFAGDASRYAIAKPLYGTTLSHYAVLWKLWGPQRVKAWHHRLRAAGIREVNGNAQVKDLVSQGVCVAGFTDTDDFFEARDSGAAVTMRPIQIATEAGWKTICIPNSVAIIRDAPHEKDARALVDYLLSEATELALARSSSRQIPLGAIEDGKWPAEVRALRTAMKRSVELNDLRKAREECLAWLKSEYAP